MLLTLEEMRDILTALDPETKRLPPGFRAFGNAIEAAVIEKLCAGVEMPEHAVSVSPYEINTIFWEAGHEYAGLSSKLFTADQLRAYGAACRLKALEDAATEAERMTMYPGGRQEAPAHDTVWHAARAIRALRGEA